MGIIAVDVDLTVVDSLTPWLEWFKKFTDKPVQNLTRTYNLVPEMKAILEADGLKNYLDPLSYWRHTDLYDELYPVEGSIEALYRAKRDGGHQIVFVSSCFPEHTQSKINFVDRFFPFNDGFVATHEKHFIAYDELIDDKLEHMHLGAEQRPTSAHTLFTGIRADGFEKDRLSFSQLNRWDDYYR